jgi:hypothetical protein
MRKQRSLSPQRLASQFVDASEPINIGRMIEAEPAAWEALTESLRKPRTDPTSSEICAMEGRLSDALPEGLRITLRDYSDGRTSETTIAEDAAFLVGLELGRRLKGAA